MTHLLPRSILPFRTVPSWAGQIGQDFDALPLGLGPQPPVTGVDFQLTVIGMPGRGNQGEVVVLTRDEDGGIFSIDRLNRLWTDNGFFPDRYVAGDLSVEELDEGYLAWSPWFGNPSTPTTQCDLEQVFNLPVLQMTNPSLSLSALRPSRGLSPTPTQMISTLICFRPRSRSICYGGHFCL